MPVVRRHGPAGGPAPTNRDWATRRRAASVAVGQVAPDVARIAAPAGIERGAGEAARAVRARGDAGVPVFGGAADVLAVDRRAAVLDLRAVEQVERALGVVAAPG